MLNSQMPTYSGRLLSYADPKPESIDPGDIARGLARTGRFAGQTHRFYSVAEHSVHCATVARCAGYSVAAQLECLLHDAAEAYLGDIVRPAKHLLPDYQRLELGLQDAVRRRFDLVSYRPASVDSIDEAMLHLEAAHLLPANPPSIWWKPDPAVWSNGEEVPIEKWVEFGNWSPDHAERVFATWLEDLYTNDWRLRRER